ncbi:MAG: lipid II flippase MurJ, partial [Chlamydiota bacterium]
MEKDTSRTIATQAAHFFSGTMISRITGLLRDITMAACFGATPLVAAFMIAFRLTNLLRRVLGEGAMQSALIPYFESLKKENTAGAHRFFRDLILLVTLFLLGFIVCVEAGCALWLSFAPPAADWKDVIILTMFSLPSLVFICLYGLFSSFLQCEKRFFLPGVAPVFFNLVWITAALMLKDLPSMQAMQGLSLALIVAYGMQWLVISGPVFARLSEHLDSWRIKIELEPVKKLLKPLFFAILGVSAAQINSNLDPLFARGADLQGPVYLWYAIRVQQLPLALFGIAIASALLPALSRARDAGDRAYYKQMLSGAIYKTALFMIPLTFLMISLGGSTLNLLFGHGDFSAKLVTPFFNSAVREFQSLFAF